MSSSLRSRRMARNHRRLAQQPRLNLVALMDIFTILVLFLMVNNGEVEVLQADPDISLPESRSEQRPEPALTIRISADTILIGRRSIPLTRTALAQPESSLQALALELQEQAAVLPGLSQHQPEPGRAVIIMGDRETPYWLLKRIMATCADQGFRDISLAVHNIPAAPIGQSIPAQTGGLAYVRDVPGP